MSKNNTRKWIARLLVTMLTLLGLGQTMVHAIDNGNGSTPEPTEHLTDVIITKVVSDAAAQDRVLGEGEDYDTPLDIGTIPGTPLKGVSFTYYSVSKEQLDMMKAAPGDYDTAGEVELVPGVGAGVVTGETLANGQVTVSNLPEGFYWFIENPKGIVASSAAVPFGLALPFTNRAGTGYLEEIYVYPKNTLTDDEPDIEKTVDKDNVAIGEEHTWTVSLDIPIGIEDYDKFSFYDNIDSRLDFMATEPVVVTATGISLDLNVDYTVDFTDPKLEVVFTQAGRMKLKDANPKKVNVSFKTKVNNTAIMGQEIPNTATLEFNMGHGVDKSKTPGTIPSVHTGGKAFVKKDEKTGATINGAEFKIKNSNGQFVNVGVNGVITFGGSGTTFTSANGGKFEVRGLPYGSYVLVETKAPQGYALPTNPETGFTVDATSYHSNPTEIVVGQEPDADVVKTIKNRLLVIPQTGGIGTALFTIIGAVMMLFSALFYKRTKEA